jgi:hypothetical protein
MAVRAMAQAIDRRWREGVKLWSMGVAGAVSVWVSGPGCQTQRLAGAALR